MDVETKEQIAAVEIKKEKTDDHNELPEPTRTSTPASVIDISSTDSDSDNSDDDSDVEEILRKRRKLDGVLPLGFLDPIRPEERMIVQTTPAGANTSTVHSNAVVQSFGMDHVRVHPRFLHSNATSHKWALGAFAELLDNSLDEVCNGATYVLVDVLINKRDKNKMLLVEDNGGGMTPDKMRQCMSLGYSVKSKMANTIGQYGNGFKTSTMRLGADVIVFSRCPGADGTSSTQSIGMMSYTFLRSTGKEDIVVPMVDYERSGQDWNKLMRSSPNDWNRNLDTILKWSPYESEDDLLQQFNQLKDRGTRIIIYNLWEDDEGQLELDFDVDPSDIQIRGVNRDEKKIEMAKDYPNSKHFLTYRHSLRSYASILYLRIPPGFRIILRGKDIDHHNLVNDLMFTKAITYRPVAIADGTPKDPNTFAVVTLGFVKDAKYHIDIQGFNVYHKNRLIKPFWRVWNAAGSDGRGVIGVLEANFVEPAHDKQGFERTKALARLEARLVVIQKSYWSTNCHEIGYARRRRSNKSVSPDRDYTPSDKGKSSALPYSNGHLHSDGGSATKRKREYIYSDSRSKLKETSDFVSQECMPSGRPDCIDGHPHSRVDNIIRDEHASTSFNAGSIVKLEGENRVLSERLEQAGGAMEAQREIEKMDKEQESLIEIFAEERSRRDAEEDILRNRLKDASNTIQDLLEKVKALESRRVLSCKTEH
ncbi:hypothetical protein C3L33_13327, partial [Rhododendron williamsianum]